MVFNRLEASTFKVPAFNFDQDSLAITSDQLHCILTGIKLSSGKYRKHYQHQSLVC
jgi:hypothetical protein